MNNLLRTITVGGLFLLLVANGPITKHDPTIGATYYPAGSAPDYPFSKAVRAGDFVYVSGQIGTGPDGKLVEGFDAQARQTMDNLAAVLREQGLTFNDVVKCTVMIGDMSKWSDFNVIYRTYFNAGRFPARSAFGANGLALGAALEVDCIAYAPIRPGIKR